MSDDLYEILGLTKEATDSEIRTAYRKLALQYHPDKNEGDEEAAKTFRKIAEAYEVLSDPEKRAAYDQQGMPGARDAGFQGFQDDADIFRQYGDIFGDAFQQRYYQSRPQPTPGRDVRARLPLTFLEAALGAKKEIEIPKLVACAACDGFGTRSKTPPQACSACGGTGHVSQRAREQGGFFSFSSACPECHGRGINLSDACPACGGDGLVEKPTKVVLTIPPGVESGKTLRLTGQGEAGQYGGPAGNLFVELEVADDSHFTRSGNDIRSDVLVPVATALLGGKVDVRTIHGVVNVTVPPCTSSDRTLRIRGQGIKATPAGDHLARVVIQVPETLSDDAREAIATHLTADAT
ncbi:MAG: J domain-containing protein [Planctomycetota bacterium]